jgi:large subunit ribosomal protein L28
VGVCPAVEEDIVIMAQRCEICGKGTQFGCNVSHAHNRRFRPNLQDVRAVVNGTHRRVRVCTRCLRSGRVVKPVRRRQAATTA